MIEVKLTDLGTKIGKDAKPQEMGFLRISFTGTDALVRHYVKGDRMNTETEMPLDQATFAMPAGMDLSDPMSVRRGLHPLIMRAVAALAARTAPVMSRPGYAALADGHHPNPPHVRHDEAA